MIRMQVGAHDNVDILWRTAGRREIREIPRGAAVVPFRPERPRLVLSDTSVDQDRFAAETYQMALNGEKNLPSREIDVIGQRVRKWV